MYAKFYKRFYVTPGHAFSYVRMLYVYDVHLSHALPLPE
jgi:hypothetical protein